jgi:NAD(P)-dependent dehydrogenase (short-subunit alcohol dehydrogenase family)
MAAQPESQGPAWGRGRIVNISSRGAFRGEPDTPAYGASKAGLNSLSQSLAKALAARAVYVYCLAPGFVETDMAAGHLAGPGGADILAQHPLGIIDVNGASYLRTEPRDLTRTRSYTHANSHAPHRPIA